MKTTIRPIIVTLIMIIGQASIAAASGNKSSEQRIKISGNMQMSTRTISSDDAQNIATPIPIIEIQENEGMPQGRPSLRLSHDLKFNYSEFVCCEQHRHRRHK